MLCASDISELDNFGELTANIIKTNLTRKTEIIAFLISLASRVYHGSFMPLISNAALSNV